MPITQPPSLSVIDLEHRNFLISFGVTAIDFENQQTVVVPNLGSQVGSLYGIDLVSVNTPARGNIPAIRAMGFSLSSIFIGGGPVTDEAQAPLYIWNPQSGQVYSFNVPVSVTAAAGFIIPGVANGMVPFYCSPTQTIYVMRASGVSAPSSFEIRCAIVLLTYDAPAFYTVSAATPLIPT